MNLDDIVTAIRHNQIRITDHADEEALADRLTFDEIFTSVFQGEIIEGLSQRQTVPQLFGVRGDLRQTAGSQCVGIQPRKPMGCSDHSVPS